MSEENGSVLVIHPGTLGDVLLSLRAMRRLKGIFHEKRLVWVGQTEIGAMLLSCSEVDAAIGIEGSFISELFVGSQEWKPETNEILASCTHAVCWLSDPDQTIERNLAQSGIHSLIVRSPKDSRLTSVHVEDRFLETLAGWELPPYEIVSRKLEARPEDDSLLNADYPNDFQFSSQPLVIIHPSSGSSHKCAPISLFAMVAEGLRRENDRRLAFLKGHADEVVFGKLWDHPGGKDYQVIEGKSLSVLVRYLSRVALFIGNDSGIAHLAAACGVPSILLFGPTDPGRWAPRADHVHVIQGKPCKCADWTEVQQCDQKPCLGISVDNIVEIAETWLHLPMRRTSHPLYAGHAVSCL